TFAMQNPQPDKWLHAVADTYVIPENIEEADIEWLTFLKEEVEDRLRAFRLDIERALVIANESDGQYHYGEALQADLHNIDEALARVNSWGELQQFMQEAKLKNLSAKRVECSEEKKERIKQIRKGFRDGW